MQKHSTIKKGVHNHCSFKLLYYQNDMRRNRYFRYCILLIVMKCIFHTNGHIRELLVNKLFLF